MSTLGTPSSKVDPEVARFWRAVKLLIEGNDPLVRRSAVTSALRDLEQGLTPTPGIIPAPTGLVATGLFAKIMLEWNSPADGGSYNTEVFRSQTDDLGTAVLVLVAPPELTMIVDDTLPQVSTAQTYYYWIRFASETGVGLFNQAAGTAATTATDPAYVLELLAGEITASELHSTLTSRINLIDTPTTGLVAKMSAVEAELDTINTTLSGLQNIPAYDNATTYAADDMVSYDGGLYRALGATTGNLPTNATYWEKVGDYASLGEAVGAHAAQLSDHETRITDNEGDITAEATARETLATQMRGAYTGTDIASVTTGLLKSEKDARSTAIAAEVSARETLATQMRGAYTGTDIASVTTGLLYAEKAARSSADGAQVTRIEALETTVSDPATGLPKAHALIAEEQTARADGDSAVATSVSTLAATVNAQADNLVNPLTKVGHNAGWTAFTAAPAVFDIGGRKGVGALSSVNGSTGYYSDYFEIDPQGIYEVRCSWYKGATGNWTYLGLNTLPSTSVAAYNPDTGVLSAPTANPYWFYSNSVSGWRDMVCYLAGPYADLSLVPKQAQNVQTMCFVVQPGQTQVRLRLLNGYSGDGAAPYVAWFTGVSVRNIAQSMTAAIRQESLVRAIATGPDWNSGTAYALGQVVHYQGVLYQAILAGTNKVPPDQPTYWKAITNSLYAQYTVKTDVNGKVAGFGLANDGATSIFEIVADRFAICNMSGTGAKVPFVVDATYGVVMDTALIKDGTITNAKIASLAADKLYAASGTIASAVIGTGHISNAMIANAAITNAKIGTAAVDTLNLAGQAVTIPSGAYTASGISVPGWAYGTDYNTSFVTIQTITYTSSGNPTVVACSALPASSSGLIALRLVRSVSGVDTILMSSIESGIYILLGATISFSIKDVPPAGVVTYKMLALKNTGNVTSSVYFRSLTALETKR